MRAGNVPMRGKGVRQQGAGSRSTPPRLRTSDARKMQQPVTMVPARTPITRSASEGSHRLGSRDSIGSGAAVGSTGRGIYQKQMNGSKSAACAGGPLVTQVLSTPTPSFQVTLQPRGAVQLSRTASDADISTPLTGTSSYHAMRSMFDNSMLTEEMSLLSTSSSVWSTHPGDHDKPYRPLSVVPQRPRIRGGSEAYRSALGSGHFYVQANRISWADGAKRRAHLEHEEAQRDIDLIKQMIAVHIDVLPAPDSLERRQELEAAERRRIREAEKKREEEAAEALARAPPVDEVEALAVSKFDAEDDIELSVEASEELRILAVTAPEGWVMARNAKGEQGLVPEGWVTIKLAEDPAADASDAPAPESSAKPLNSWQLAGKKSSAVAGLLGAARKTKSPQSRRQGGQAS